MYQTQKKISVRTFTFTATMSPSPEPVCPGAPKPDKTSSRTDGEQFDGEQFDDVRVNLECLFKQGAAKTPNSNPTGTSVAPGAPMKSRKKAVEELPDPVVLFQ